MSPSHLEVVGQCYCASCYEMVAPMIQCLAASDLVQDSQIQACHASYLSSAV